MAFHKKLKTIMIFNKNTKAIVRSPKRNINFFDIIVSIWRGDTLATCFFILCLHYILRTSLDLIKGNSFTLKKTICRQSPGETATNSGHRRPSASRKSFCLSRIPTAWPTVSSGSNISSTGNNVNIRLGILIKLLSSFFCIRSVRVVMVHPYSSIDTKAAWKKKLHFILSVAFLVFVRRVLMSFSVDATLLPCR